MAKDKLLPGFLGKLQCGYRSFRGKMAPVDRVMASIGRVLYHLRKVFMTIPVVYLAMRVFVYAKEKLPAEVGILLQENGTYRYLMDRAAALNLCLAVTGVCLLMMFMSRRIMYPWIISLFSLVLPVFLVISNMLVI